MRYSDSQGRFLAFGNPEDGMLYKLGRFLQLVGLVVLPVGVAGNLAERLTLWESLTVSGIGVLCFYAGWQIQQWTAPK